MLNFEFVLVRGRAVARLFSICVRNLATRIIICLGGALPNRAAVVVRNRRDNQRCRKHIIGLVASSIIVGIGQSLVNEHNARRDNIEETRDNKRVPAAREGEEEVHKWGHLCGS